MRVQPLAELCVRRQSHLRGKAEGHADTIYRVALTFRVKVCRPIAEVLARKAIPIECGQVCGGDETLNAEVNKCRGMRFNAFEGERHVDRRSFGKITLQRLPEGPALLQTRVFQELERLV